MIIPNLEEEHATSYIKCISQLFIPLLVVYRYDWHQTSSHAVLSIYCKQTRPELTVIKANRVCLSVDVRFDNGKNRFQKEMTLEGVSVGEDVGSTKRLLIIKAVNSRYLLFAFCSLLVLLLMSLFVRFCFASNVKIHRWKKCKGRYHTS